MDIYLADGSNETLIVGKDLIPSVEAALVTSLKVLEVIPGSALLETTYRHPLYNTVSPVIHGDHVISESGTGIVHTAPGHGFEDFQVWKSKYSISDIRCHGN